MPTSALRVSTKLGSACTSTCSLTEPTFKGVAGHLQDDAGLHLVVAEAVHTHFQLIRPTGRSVITKLPSGPLKTLRAGPVAVYLAFTPAPATGNAVWSPTVPLICDVEMACA